MKTFTHLGEFPKRVITGFFLVMIFGGAYFFIPALFSVLLVVVAGIMLLHEWPALVTLTCWQHCLLTLIYPLTPLLGLIALNHCYHECNWLVPLYPFFVAWVADTCGYLVGKCCGTHKMCPTISPGKTWEGFAGSFVGVVILHFFIIDKLFFYPHYPSLALQLATITIVSLVLTSVAFLGGLLLSWLKRRNNVKDAGCLLPGHGGMLDRFDGVLAVTLVVMVLVLFHALA